MTLLAALPAAPLSINSVLPSVRIVGAEEVMVAAVTERSQDCTPGCLFAVIPGKRVHGQAFLPEALARGAAALLVEQELPGTSVPQCLVPDVRAAFATLCQALAGSPATKLPIVGVTGTNGKSTVTWMIRSILKAAGLRCGVLGTVEYHDGVVSAPSPLTTPDSRTLAEWLARMVAAEADGAAIEISSHALDQRRTQAVPLATAVVTNITHDHFDYHGNYEHYWHSKARILEQLSPGGVVTLNRDDPGSWALRDRVPSSAACIGFGFDAEADVRAEIVDESLDGTRFRLSLHGHAFPCVLRTVGRHNVANALAAAAASSVFGVGPEEIIDGLEQFTVVPGRMDLVTPGQPIAVFIDYAHTDDALRRCLQSLKSLTTGRVICVFGAGGNRDRTKRPLLGRAATLADVAIITSDNPRSEPPLRIIDDILEGMREQPLRPLVEVDRAAAIAQALTLARPGDSVLIAGKGHEQDQIVGDQRLPFDDRTVALEVLSRLGLVPSSTLRRSA